VNRRHFITLLGGAAAAWPLAVRAQQAQKVARIGFLGSTFASPWKSRVEAFQSGLHDLGYVEGKNIAIEFRWAEEKYDQLPLLAAELIRLNVDVLVTYGTRGASLPRMRRQRFRSSWCTAVMPSQLVSSRASRGQAGTLPE
jgi:putative ABC transport system substrate-binding protein